jgi:hypothetical protein
MGCENVFQMCKSGSFSVAHVKTLSLRDTVPLNTLQTAYEGVVCPEGMRLQSSFKASLHSKHGLWEAPS